MRQADVEEEKEVHGSKGEREGCAMNARDKLVRALVGEPPSYDDLRKHIQVLQDFIEWLATASDSDRRVALNGYTGKKPIKKGGAPRKRSIDDDAELATVVVKFQKHYGYTSRTQTIRRVRGDTLEKHGRRRSLVDSPEERAKIKTLLNRLSKAKPKNKSSQKLKAAISGKK